MGFLVGVVVIDVILYAIFNAAIGVTAGWIAVGVWTVIAIMGWMGEMAHRGYW